MEDRGNRSTDMVSKEETLSVSPICQLCGVEAPTKQASFHQHVGLIVWHVHWHLRGYMCKRCVHVSFWRGTLTTLTLGWWSIPSLIVAPILLVSNLLQYLAAMPLQPAPLNAKPPDIAPSVSRVLQPSSRELSARLAAGEDLLKVAQEVAARVGISATEVARYLGASIARPPKEEELLIRRKPR